MDSMMKYLQFILLGLAMFVVPILPSLVWFGLSLFYLKKHNWEHGFLKDKWGMLGIMSFLLGTIAYVFIFMPYPF